MAKPLIIVWFRNDLRITDNPALSAAASKGYIIPIYIFDDSNTDLLKLGEASRWWLHNSLLKLNKQLKQRLICQRGPALEILQNLIDETGTTQVFWNRCYEAQQISRDTEIKKCLTEKGIIAHSFNASLLWEPWEILKKDKTPYKVFTAFYQNGCLKSSPPRMPIPSPHRLLIKDLSLPDSTPNSLKLLPTKPWYNKLNAHWEVGEKEAFKKIKAFTANNIKGYKIQRDYPHKNGTSLLSPHLHFGEISPYQIWAEIELFKSESHKKTDTDTKVEDSEHFQRELIWREFSYYLLYHFPQLTQNNLQSKFDDFEWKSPQHYLSLWQKGLTGFPIIDAGMRELWQTGYMHNRVRMLVGSFLVKNLRIHWHHGQEWFWDCLVDADLANNSCSWQWVAGSGVDAAPYFRIFNPVTQSKKFDPDGLYIKKYVPELSQLTKRYLHEPWLAPDIELKRAKITLGKTYPKPIIDLQDTRKEALTAFQALKS